MALTVRLFADYPAALANAYDEEISGHTYFARLAEHHQGHAAKAFLVLAELETVTAEIIRPLIDRNSAPVLDEAFSQASGIREADVHAAMSWGDFVAMMANDYPIYVQEFEILRAAAPEEDRPVLDRLIGHEAAMIEFARREVAGDANSLAPLLDYLKTCRANV